MNTMSMSYQPHLSTTKHDRTHDLFLRLAALEPLPVPNHQPGMMLPTWSHESRGIGTPGEPGEGNIPASTSVANSSPAQGTATQSRYIPVLSVYLDLRPLIQGNQPVERPYQVMLRERLRQIAATFAPRGVAFDTIQEASAEIERFLDTNIPPDTAGAALFVSGPHHLFETLLSDMPFDSQVVVSATPDLFQLARLLADRAVVVVATVELNAARIFLLHRGRLHELRQLADDSKYYHEVRSTIAMNQAHYQRHARETRARFAGEVARDIEQVVAHEQVTQVILTGEVEALPLVRAALSPSVAKLVRVIPRSLAAGAAEFTVSAATILDAIQPLLQEVKAEQDHVVVEQLVEAIQSDGLGVAGLEPTYHALSNGQARMLILLANDTQSPAQQVNIPGELRSNLIALAARTDAGLAIIGDSPELQRLGGVGALLRYRSAPSDIQGA